MILTTFGQLEPKCKAFGLEWLNVSNMLAKWRHLHLLINFLCTESLVMPCCMTCQDSPSNLGSAEALDLED